MRRCHDSVICGIAVICGRHHFVICHILCYYNKFMRDLCQNWYYGLESLLGSLHAFLLRLTSSAWPWPWPVCLASVPQSLRAGSNFITL